MTSKREMKEEKRWNNRDGRGKKEERTRGREEEREKEEGEQLSHLTFPFCDPEPDDKERKT